MSHLFIIIIIVFSLNLKSQETFKFLSHSEFSHLTASEKKLYVNEIRVLINTMTESAKVSFWQYLFLPTAQAQSQRAEFNTPSINTVTELDRLDSLMRAARMYKKAGAEHNSDVARQMADENSKAFSLRMNIVGHNLKTPADVKIYNELQSEFSKDFSREASTIKKPKTVFLASVKSSEPLLQKNNPQKLDSKSKDSKTVVKISKPMPEANGAYCIYAGFVIYGEKCLANKKLPVDFKLDEIKNDWFICDNDSEILCNPLLFGFKKNCFKVEGREVCSEKPICIERSVNATKNCLQKSDTTEQLRQVLEIWKNPKNKVVYEKFMNDMNTLCDAKNFSSDDVRQTCKVASTRFNGIIENNFPGKSDLKINNEPSVNAPAHK